jgi:hypothetical protein
MRMTGMSPFFAAAYVASLPIARISLPTSGQSRSTAGFVCFEHGLSCIWAEFYCIVGLVSTLTNTLQSNYAIDDIWVRCSEYEIRDEYIRPKRGCTIEKYRPWLEFGPPVAKDVRRQPYHSLLELIAKLQITPAVSGFTIRQDQTSMLLDWCVRNGLLGILLHRLETVRLPERTGVSDAFEGVRGPSSVRFIRTSRGWEKKESIRFGKSGRLRPGVFMREASGYEMRYESISEYAMFMPDLAGSKNWGKLPSPGSEQFWRWYSEPLHQFLSVVNEFKRAVDNIRDCGSSQNRYRGIQAIQLLAAPVRSNLFVKPDGQLALGWSCHSLLASFAMMAAMDLGQSRLLICQRPDCGVYFATKSKKALYCSESCRGTVQMRRRRQKLRDMDSRIR